jgi:hypothetical protein
MGVDLKPGDRMEGEWFPVIWPPQLVEESAAE